MIKEEVIDYLGNLGADIVGVASAKAWPQANWVPKAFHPDSLWPKTQSVIVIGLQMPLPIVETTPSVQHTELYRTCNRILDNMAFELTRWLNRRGYASTFFSRDGYASIEVLIEEPVAAFAHIFAAQYAGLGTVGVNHTILTRQYGPRVRFVSVFTEADIPPDPMLEKNLCIRCGVCVECCPVNAFTITKDALSAKKSVVVAEYNKRLCGERHKLLRDKGCYPCGICIKVCPVGEDRTLYERENVLQHYRQEAKSLADNRAPADPVYSSWVHIRRYGSWPLDE